MFGYSIIIGLIGIIYLNVRDNNVNVNVPVNESNNTKYNNKLLAIIGHLKEEHGLTTQWNNKIKTNDMKDTLFIGSKECYVAFEINQDAIFVLGDKKLNLGVKFIKDVVASLQNVRLGFNEIDKRKISKLINAVEKFRVDNMYNKYKLLGAM
jgi:hypothetical protein